MGSLDDGKRERAPIPWHLIAIAALLAAALLWMIDAATRLEAMLDRVEQAERDAAGTSWEDARDNVRQLSETPTQYLEGLVEHGRDPQHWLCWRRRSDDAPAPRVDPRLG